MPSTNSTRLPSGTKPDALASASSSPPKWSVVASISERPFAYPQWKPEDPVRRAMARRFPYAVFFDIEPQRLVVMAIAHSSRRPGYWGGRIKPPRRAPNNEEGP